MGTGARFPVSAALLMLSWLCGMSLVARSQGSNGDKDGVDLTGKLELVDLPPEATPVTALTVSIYSSDPLRKISAGPDATGAFVLRKVPPGRYSLDLPVPARIRSFASGSRPLNPQDFELLPGDAGPLSIVLSYKASSLFVDVGGIPSETGKVVALLFPDDPYLTPPGSGVVNPVLSGKTAFLHVPPGQYRLFAVDELCQEDIAFHSVLRKALTEKATRIEVTEKNETRVAASYLDRDTLREGIRQSAPPPDSPKARMFYSTPLRCQ